MSVSDIIIIISALVCIAALVCVKITKKKSNKKKIKSECMGCPFCGDCQKYYVGCTEEDLQKIMQAKNDKK